MVYDDAVKIGDPIPDPFPAVFELVIHDIVPFVDPDEYGLKERSIKPEEYYITSGDAVEKAKVLERAFWDLAGELRRKIYNFMEVEFECSNSEAQRMFADGIRPSKPERFHEYEAAIWKAAGNSRRLLNLLQKAKGKNCFLETEWDNHRLLCIPKNPRIRKE